MPSNTVTRGPEEKSMLLRLLPLSLLQWLLPCSR
jgi:hypothetical protein